MYCLKCGKKTEDEHVFCAACQHTMEKYPIKPGTAVTLPKRDASGTVKRATPRKRTVPLDEQILALRKTLRRTRLLVVVLVVVLAMAAALLVHEVSEIDLPAIGQNYTININPDQ